VEPSLLAYALQLPDDLTIQVRLAAETVALCTVMRAQGMVDVIDPDHIHAAISHGAKNLFRARDAFIIIYVFAVQ
jgi:hypothetical protein